jgi:hypothetical protein
LSAVTILLVLAAASWAQARPYTFEWDGNLDGVTTGYLVYYGTGPGAYQPAAGIDVGLATEFQVDLTPGQTYYFAVRAYNSNNQLGDAANEMLFAVPLNSTINVSASSVVAGGTVSATIADGPGSRFDWVGVYPVGAGASTRTNWKYLNGAQSAPGAGVTNASVSFTMPTTPGQYNLRFFANDSYTVLATSATVTVTAPAPLTPAITAVAAGNTITATVINGPGSRFDWVGLYPAGTTASTRTNWKYLNGTLTAPASGLSAATVTFTLPTTAGNYNLRFFANDGYTVLATSATLIVAGPTPPPPTPTIAASVSGNTVTGTVASGPRGRADWVGIFQVGAAATQQIDWKYLNNSRTVPTTGMASGTVTFAKPTATGQYNLRFFAGDGYTVLATSSSFTVAAPATATITPSATTLTGGAAFTATIANGPAARLDWVAFYPVGNASTEYLDWKYLNGAQSPPSSGSAAATLSFTAPATPGVYNMRFFSNNSYALLATSPSITVTAPASSASLTLSTTAVSVGGNVTATVGNGPRGRYDWVALFPVGAGASEFVDWKYLNGSTSAPGTGVANASLTFSMPRAGQYVLRFFSNNSYTVLATSSTVSVAQSGTSLTLAQTTVAAGNTISVSVAGGPGARLDWVALYPVDSGLPYFINWRYMNNAQSAPAGGQASATITFTAPPAAGQYIVRLLSNNGYSVLATSPAMIVTK